MPNLENAPKWIQMLVANLKRERDTAIQALNKWNDSQTPSKIWAEDIVCLGEQKGPSFKKHFIQSRRVTIEHAGVHLDILIRDQQIELGWSGLDHGMDEIALIPESFQKCRLLHPKNMRR